MCLRESIMLLIWEKSPDNTFFSIDRFFNQNPFVINGWIILESLLLMYEYGKTFG